MNRGKGKSAGHDVDIILYMWRSVAQWLERGTQDQKIVGSNPGHGASATP